MSDTMTAVEELKSTWEGHFKPLAARIEAEEKARGEASAETKAAIEKVNDALDAIEVRWQKMTLEQRAPSEKLAPFVKQFWAAHGKPEISFEEAKAHADALWKYVRKGAVSPDEQKALIEGDDPQAGFLAPPQFINEMLKGVVEWSPIREIARVVTTTAQSVKFPKRTGLMSARWVGEQETKTPTNEPSLGIEEIPTHELYALVDVSNWLLEDAGFDIEGWLREDAEEQFGVAESAAFVAGTGVKQPEGFLNATGVTGIPSGTSDVLSADDLIKLYFELKTAYARNATWVMKRSTIRDARLLKDAVNGNYLWAPGLAGVSPATILDRPYVEAPDMPAVADAAKAVAFGDFRRGYIIVDRMQMAVLRDPYTQARNGMVEFIFRRRVGGQVVIPEAIKVLTIA